MPDDDKSKLKPVEEHTLLDVNSAPKPENKPADEIKRLGQVSITAELGHGGMGKVYRGHHLGLDVPVAVKTMGAHISSDEKSRQRFLREARTAAKLDHPNIVRVLDVNEENGTPYIVMEYVDGTDLSELMKRHGALHGMAAVRVIAQVADGLAHAHEQGIIHRDIKPHNIFVSRDGRVKLGDFGLARAVEATTELTQPGAAVGTAHYMSPEQASGDELDQRSDVYSLGVTAWHLITGQTPFAGTTPVSIAVQHVNKDIPYERAKFGHIPDAAVYLMINMTARQPERRPSAQAVHDGLAQMVMQHTGRGLKLGTLKELLRDMSAEPAVTPPPAPPQGQDFQFSPPAQPPATTPPPQGLSHTPPGPAYPTHPGHTTFGPPTEDSSNKLLWIALAVFAGLLLVTGGCFGLMVSCS
jgi:serine/threonine protein kinase